MPAEQAPASQEADDRVLLRRWVHSADMDAFRTIVERHQADLLRTAHALTGDSHAAQDAVQEGFLRLCRHGARLAGTEVETMAEVGAEVGTEIGAMGAEVGAAKENGTGSGMGSETGQRVGAKVPAMGRGAARSQGARPAGSLGGWLCTVVRHVCIDHLRSLGVLPVQSLNALGLAAETDGQDKSAGSTSGTHGQASMPSGVASESCAGSKPHSPPSDSPEQTSLVWQAVAHLPPLHRAAVLLRYRDGLGYRAIAERMGKSASHVGVLLHEALSRLRTQAALRTAHEEML